MKKKHGKRRTRELIRCMKRGLWFGRMLDGVAPLPFELIQGGVRAADDADETGFSHQKSQGENVYQRAEGHCNGKEANDRKLK